MSKVILKVVGSDTDLRRLAEFVRTETAQTVPEGQVQYSIGKLLDLQAKKDGANPKRGPVTEATTWGLIFVVSSGLATHALYDLLKTAVLKGIKKFGAKVDVQDE